MESFEDIDLSKMQQMQYHSFLRAMTDLLVAWFSPSDTIMLIDFEHERFGDCYSFECCLCRSLIYEQGESFDGSGCITSALNVARGNSRQLDLYLAETKVDGKVQQNVGFLHICEYDSIVEIYGSC